jgi:hypothetical protein
MTPDATPPRRETVTEMQRLLSRARPDQIRRLLDDIMSDERDATRSHCESRRRVAGGRAS